MREDQNGDGTTLPIRSNRDRDSRRCRGISSGKQKRNSPHENAPENKNVGMASVFHILEDSRLPPRGPNGLTSINQGVDATLRLNRHGETSY